MNRFFAIAAVLLAVGAFMTGWQSRGTSAQRDIAQHQAVQAQVLADAIRNARAIEQRLSRALTDIGEQYEQAKQQAVTVEADVMADLRAGTVRLRREWDRCETRRVSDVAIATAERDAATADRDALAAAIVRAGRDGDDHVNACQAVIREYLAVTSETAP